MPPKGHKVTLTDDPQTWDQLAKALGVSVVSVNGWRNLPGAPADKDLGAWQAFQAENELGIAGNKGSASREELLKANIEKRNKLLDLQIAKEERTVVDRTVVDEMLLRLGSLQKTVLYQKLEKELPAKAAAHGAAVEPMQILGREIADGLCELFGQEMDRWQNST